MLYASGSPQAWGELGQPLEAKRQRAVPNQGKAVMTFPFLFKSL